MKQIGIGIILLLMMGCSEQPSNNEDNHKSSDAGDKMVVKDSIPDQQEEEEYIIDQLATGVYEWQSDKRVGKLDIRQVYKNSFDFVLTIREEDVCNGKVEGHVELDQQGKGKYTDEACEGIYFTFLKNGISIKEYNCYEDQADKCAFDGFYIPEIAWSEKHLKDLMDELHMGEGEFDFYASFTEPFWTFYIKGDQLIWEDFDQGHKLYEIDKRFDPDAQEQTIVYSNGKIRGELLIKKEAGSDGMSNITYPYNVIWNDSHYGGGGTEFQKEEAIEE